LGANVLELATCPVPKTVVVVAAAVCLHLVVLEVDHQVKAA